MNIPAQYITYVSLSCIAIGQCDFLLQWHILLSILASTLLVVHALYIDNRAYLCFMYPVKNEVLFWHYKTVKFGTI